MTIQSLLLFISLAAAHILGDFLLQTERMVLNKNRIKILLLHTGEHALLGYLLAGLWTNWQIPLVIFVTHTLIDGVKVRIQQEGRFQRRELALFTIDQFAHLAVAALLAWLVTGRAAGGLHMYWADSFGIPYYQFLVLLSGAVVTVKAGAIVVMMLVKPRLELLKQHQLLSTSAGRSPSNPLSMGFKDGGWVIGMLERALIFIFVLASQTAAIGFLIAAKSIFRFGEISYRSQRMQAEYILIGTLFSFLFGLLTSYAAKLLFDWLGQLP
jgi:hypothetical protein